MLAFGTLPIANLLMLSSFPVPRPSQPVRMVVAIVKSIPHSAFRGSFLEFMKFLAGKLGRLQNWMADAIFAFLEERFKNLAWTMPTRATF